MGREASPDTIKDAFRALVKRHHPDVETGGIDRFRAIDTAYKVLRDPGRRATYDETGAVDLKAVKTDMQRVIEFMAETFNRLLVEGKALDERVSVVKMMTKIVADNIGQLKTSISEEKRQMTALLGLRKTISREGEDGENLFTKVIDGHVARKQSAVDKAQDDVRILELAADELGNYSSFARVVEAVQMVWASTASATTATGFGFR